MPNFDSVPEEVRKEFMHNKLFRSLFRNMMDGFAYHKMVFGDDGKPVDYIFLEVNIAFEKLTGLKRDAIVGRRVTEVLPGIENDPADWIGVYGKVASTGEPVRFENYAQALDKWYVVSAFCPEKGYFVATFEDVTKRKKAEEDVLEAKQNFDALFNNKSVGLAYCQTVFDKSDAPVDFVFLDVNATHSVLTGLKRKAVLGKKVTEAIPGFAPSEIEWQNRVAMTGEPAHREMFEPNLKRWYDINVYSPRKDYFVSIFTDITPRKQAEIKMRKQDIILAGINMIFHEALSTRTEEELGKICLEVAEKITQSKFGFIGELNPQGLEDIAISNPGWDACKIIDSSGHRRPPGNFALHGIYGRVLKDGKSLFTNDPASHPDRIGLPQGHPPLKTFLGVPLIHNDKTIGMVAVANSEDGYSEEDVEALEALTPAIVEAFMRKRAEKALRASEQRWVATLASIGDAVIATDVSGKVTFMNYVAEALTGWSLQDALQKPLEQVFHIINEYTRKRVESPVAKVLEQGIIIGLANHTILLRKDGLEVPIDDSGAPIRDNDGNITGVVLVFRDITERKKAEENLRKLNRTLRALSNSNQALMRAVDEEEYSAEVCRIIVEDCGYALVWVGFVKNDAAKSVRPVTYAGFDKGYIDSLKITWADTERGRGPTGQAIRSGKPYVCENIKKDPNFKPWCDQATRRGYAASIVLPLLSKGKAFGALNIYSKKASPFTEEEVKLLTELANDFSYGIEMLRLRKEKERNEEILLKQASLIDLSPDAIIVRKLDGTITFWSKGAEKLYGWTKTEAIGKNIHHLLKTGFPQPLEEIVDQLKQTGHWSGELNHQTKDGYRVTLQSYWRAALDEKGEVAEMLESNVDVTERKQMQNKLEDYAVHLEELVQERTQQLKDTERLTAIGETAGMVGHDLRNPLQTVTGETYLAKEELKKLPEGEPKSNLEENIQVIAEQISYMDKIVSDLQDFVRPVTLDKKPVNLQKLLQATVSEVSVPENVKVRTKIREDLQDVPADPQLLRRVFFNLINNAVQAMPDGGTLTVKTSQQKSKKNAGRVAIQIEDTGEGIPDHIKPKIFKPLFTTKSRGQGFGLAVCKRVIEAHGGTITFQSQEGKGAQFTVELPLNADSA